MILLVTKAMPALRRMGPNVGRLVQPRHLGSLQAMSNEVPWAADNDAFGGFKPGPFLKMLGSLVDLPGCLFVTAPDVVGDARATRRSFDRWHEVIRHEAGLPVAYVLQDGIEQVGVPWEAVDAVFLGGSTIAKMSQAFADVAWEARGRGKWVHMGRVNSVRRLRYAASIRCDSVDGTNWSRFTDTYLHQLAILGHDQVGMRAEREA